MPRELGDCVGDGVDSGATEAGLSASEGSRTAPGAGIMFVPPPRPPLRGPRRGRPLPVPGVPAIPADGADDGSAVAMIAVWYVAETV